MVLFSGADQLFPLRKAGYLNRSGEWVGVDTIPKARSSDKITRSCHAEWEVQGQRLLLIVKGDFRGSTRTRNREKGDKEMVEIRTA